VKKRIQLSVTNILRFFCFLFFLSVTISLGNAAAAEFEIRNSSCVEEKAYADEVGKQLDEPLLRTFHRILMDNELSAGCGALQFTDARMASDTNGFSFGLSQFDLATRPEKSMKALVAVMSCANGELGKPLLTASDLTFLRTYGNSPTSKLRMDAAVWQRFATLRSPIEQALSTKCGRALLAAEYKQELKKFLPAADALWSASFARNPKLKPAEEFLKLYALDLENVLGGVERYRNYIEGKGPGPCNGLCKAGVTPRFIVNGSLGVSDVIRYTLQATCYGYVPEGTRQFDALRRLNRVLAEVDVKALPLSSADKVFLAGDFADIVATTKASRSGAQFQYAEQLIKAASADAGLTGKVVPIEAKRLKDLRLICKS
jgi:hypothetical protein